MGSTLDPDGIKEGDDVYFECSIDAKPRVYKIVWKFNVSSFPFIFFVKIVASLNSEKMGTLPLSFFRYPNPIMAALVIGLITSFGLERTCNSISRLI